MIVEHSFFLPVTPNAAQRTRTACRGKFAQVYLDPKYREWRAQAMTALLDIASTEDFRDVAHRPVSIVTEVVVKRPKTTKLDMPRGDNDNYEKGLWDAITETGKWWNDDSQIVHNDTTKRWTDGDEPEGYNVRITFL